MQDMEGSQFNVTKETYKSDGFEEKSDTDEKRSGSD